MEVNTAFRDKIIPGIVLLRGPSCAVLLWYVVDEVKYAIMIQQPRVATGKLTWEVPAGMLDGEKDVKGKMFEEIKEETEGDIAKGMAKGCDRVKGAFSQLAEDFAERVARIKA